MPASNPIRVPALAVAAVAAVAALLLALFDWATAAMLLGALALGWALVLGYAVGATVYRRHRTATLAVGGVLLLALLVVLRPDDDSDDDAAAPAIVSGYGAELWPNRLASHGGFILRERVDGAQLAAGFDGRGNLEPVATGPLMRELRFAPGASSGVTPLELASEGEAVVTVNPIEDGRVHHARGGVVTRVDLPIGPVVRVRLDELPREARIAYLVGAGRSLGALAALVTPLRRLPLPLSIGLFGMIGSLAAYAWAGRVVEPVCRRITEKPKPPAPSRPGQPGAAIERAPLVPRRK